MLHLDKLIVAFLFFVIRTRWLGLFALLGRRGEIAMISRVVADFFVLKHIGQRHLLVLDRLQLALGELRKHVGQEFVLLF